MAFSRGPHPDQELFDDLAPEPQSSSVTNMSDGEELDGRLAPKQDDEDKLARTVLENDKELITDGMLLATGVTNGLKSFTPDILFDHLTQNYRNAKQLYGERLIRELSGYDPAYVERNLRIPEFKRELRGKLEQAVKGLQEKGLIDKEGGLTDDALTVASIAMTAEELERLDRKGALGERTDHAKAAEGEKADYDRYRGQRYRDLAIKATIKKALRRGHRTLSKDDLVVQDKESRQKATLLYAIDASGSMKGAKLLAAKRAGIGLAFKATRQKDKVGVLLFGKEVIAEHPPTLDFLSLVKTIVAAQASDQTDLAASIERASALLERAAGAKHLIFLTDGLQTVGENPVGRVLDAASVAAGVGITVSVIGIGLDPEGEMLCRRIVDLCAGTLYLAKDYEDLDMLLIEDYYRTRHKSNF